MLKDIAKLGTASFLSQLLAFALLPILSMHYSPEHFGVLSVVSGGATFLICFFTLRLELAVFIENNEGQIKALISVVVFLIIFIAGALLLGGKFILELINVESFNRIAEWWILIVLAGALQSFILLGNSCNNRNGNYFNISISRVGQTVIFYSMAIIFAYIDNFSLNLIISFLISYVLIAVFIEYKNNLFWVFITEFKPSTIKPILSRWSNFITKKLPSTVAQNVVGFFPTLFIASMYGLDNAGLFFITKRLLTIPIMFLSKAIKEVVKKHVASRVREKQTIRSLYLRIILFCTIFGILFFPIYLYMIDAVASFVLGEGFESVGVIAFILAPMVFFKFLSGPLGFLPQVTDMQLGDMVIQFSMLAFVGVLAIYGVDLEFYRFLWVFVLGYIGKYTLEILYAVYCMLKYEKSILDLS